MIIIIFQKKQNSNYKSTYFVFTYNYKKKQECFLKTKTKIISSQTAIVSLDSFNEKLAKIFIVSELRFSFYKYVIFAELNHCFGLYV